MRKLAQNMFKISGSVLGAAMILLAFSEYIFVNEGPVAALLGAASPRVFVATLGAMLAFYLPAGLLLAALGPAMSTWTRALLVGAFVGWAIEAAMVPAAYEAVPVSYLWTSVSWHAVIDVCLGYLAFRLVMRRSWRAGLAGAVAVGFAWGVWATWVWDVARLSLIDFALMAAVIVGLWTLGTLLADRSGATMPRWTLWAAVAMNGLLWALHVPAYPVAAAGLALLAGITGLALRRAPPGPGLFVTGRPPPWRYVLPALSGGVAVVTYAVVLRTGPPIPPEELVWPLALAGALWFGAALAIGLLGARASRDQTQG